MQNGSFAAAVTTLACYDNNERLQAADFICAPRAVQRIFMARSLSLYLPTFRHETFAWL